MTKSPTKILIKIHILSLDSAILIFTLLPTTAPQSAKPPVPMKKCNMSKIC